MVVHGPKLQNKQGFLFRIVDVANELFAMAASVTRAHAMERERRPNAREAKELTDLFCRMSRRRVERLFKDLWSNDDLRKYKTAVKFLDGRYAWLEEGIIPAAPASALAPEAPKTAAKGKAKVDSDTPVAVS